MRQWPGWDAARGGKSNWTKERRQVQGWLKKRESASEAGKIDLRGKMQETGTRPYFIWWDQDVTEQDLREALASDNLYRRCSNLLTWKI